LGIEQMNYQYDKNTLDVSKLPLGIYIIVFQTENKSTKTIKILKE